MVCQRMVLVANCAWHNSQNARRFPGDRNIQAVGNIRLSLSTGVLIAANVASHYLG